MPANLRIATFNCEDLFSRPKIFSEDNKKSKELLGYVAKLQEAPPKMDFRPALINDLKKKLKGYATVNDIRDKLAKEEKPHIGAFQTLLLTEDKEQERELKGAKKSG